MDGNNTSKTILVTGGTSGIGRVLLAQLHAEGYQLLSCGRDQVRLSGLQERFSGLKTLVCDLAEADGPAQLAGWAKSQGPLHGLINCAALQIPYLFSGAEEQESVLYQELMSNYWAPLVLMHRLAPSIPAEKGYIANLSSGLAYIPLARSPNYCATKAALSHYTKSINLQTPKLLLSEVVLPLVDTPMTAGRGKNKLSAEKAAEQILSGLKRGESTIYVGKTRLLPWALRCFPRLLTRSLNQAEGAAG